MGMCAKWKAVLINISYMWNKREEKTVLESILLRYLYWEESQWKRMQLMVACGKQTTQNQKAKRAHTHKIKAVQQNTKKTIFT